MKYLDQPSMTDRMPLVAGWLSVRGRPAFSKENR